MSEVGRFRPVYSRNDIRHLQDLLLEASHQSPETNNPEAKLQKALLQRRIYELVSHANDVIEEWRELRNNLDNRLALIAKFGGLHWHLQQVLAQVSSDEFAQVLDEYGTTFRGKVITNIEQTIGQIEAATEMYKARHGWTPMKIKSEGGERSHNLALALLKGYIVVASFVWHQWTGRDPRFGKSSEPYGDYSKFIFASVLPLIQQLNSGKDGAGLPTAWPSLCEILTRMKVRDLFKPDGVPSEDGN